MSNSVKSFSVGYNPINSSNTFTSGDYITGQLTLELTKECKVDLLCIKLKGKAEVQWTENYGKTIVTYFNKEKYFSIKEFIIPEGQGNNIVDQGCHVYPFKFQIPEQDLPSSFKSSSGKIVYKLEAILKRSMRADSKAKAHFTLVHNGTIDSDLMLKAPQYGNTEKKMKLFSSGAVAMDVNIERTGYHQGEGIKVVAYIQNSSSRDIKPKYHLYEKRSYLAKGKRKVRTTDILKEVGDAVPPSAGQAVTRIITIPSATLPSILNCKILKREHRLRVSLDIKYASDPEIKLPIVILQALQDPDDAYPQFSMFSGSSALPPANGIAGMYPSLTDFEGSSC